MADASAGEVFATAQSVTAARLNNHVNGLTILPAFVSAKPTITPVGADRILTYQVSGNQLNAPSITNILALQLSDQSAATPSMRTLGTSAVQAAQGSLVPYLASDNLFAGKNQFVHVGGTYNGALAITAGAGLGTGGTAAFATNSTDLYGRMVLTSGTAANGVIATVTFDSVFTTAPFVIIVAYNSNAIQAQGGTARISVTSSSTTQFVISNSANLTASTAYHYSYIVFGK